MKLKTIYQCEACSHQSGKWLGKCPQCQAWNSMVEDVINVGKSTQTGRETIKGPKPKSLQMSEIPEQSHRVLSGISECDLVLGGGIVEGSLTLLSGEPGIGKSTLTLQMAKGLSENLKSILYITGEESTDQVARRAQRMNCMTNKMQLAYCTNLEDILEMISNIKPDFLIIDSIQVIASDNIIGSAGGISQVRYVTECLMNLIKTEKIATLLIGHVNKDGKIAGPKVLEHLVDTVLLIEGERDQDLRILRAQKNRFGGINEVGLFKMDENGLSEMKNPADYLLSNRTKNTVGSSLSICMEGQRPILIEVEALTTKSVYGYPKRTSGGFDRNRLELLIAVLQKHGKLDLSEHDVYLNIAGGFRTKDPAVDLAVCLALSSSAKNIAIPKDHVFFGEIGLTGEIRKGRNDAEREKAALKMGLSYANKNMQNLAEILKIS